MSSEKSDQAIEAFIGSLTQGGSYASLSPEQLEMMGKQAANMYLDGGTPLNKAIVKVASDYSDINGEQIKRIVEFANTAVYLAKHDQSKTAGANSSYPQFPLADAGSIIQEMSGTKMNAQPERDPDYSFAAPKKEKMASAKADSLLSDLFGASKEKTASADYSKESVVTDVMNTKDTLVGMREHLAAAEERLDLQQKEAQADYYHTVKSHLLGGGDFVDVMVAANSTISKETPDRDAKIASAIVPIVQRLAQEKIASSQALKQGVRNMEKVAHRVVNQAHPLVTGFATILDYNQEMRKVAMALEDVEKQLTQVQGFIKEKLYAGSAR